MCTSTTSGHLELPFNSQTAPPTAAVPASNKAVRRIEGANSRLAPAQQFCLATAASIRHLPSGVAQLVADHSRPHPRGFFLRIQFQYAVQVLGKIENDGHVAALAGKTGSATAARIGTSYLRQRFTA